MVMAILRKEILGGGRHGRYYVVRGGYLALLACVTIPAILYQIERLETAATFAASRLGQEFTIPFGILQFVLVALLAPALSMNALQSERASGGLELLHVAGVGPFSLVAGKFAARMMWLLLFVISGFPLFIAGTLMGGVGLESAALLVVHATVAAALGTSLGFTLSGGFRQSVPAMVLAYLILAVVYVGPPLALVFYDEALPGTRVPDAWYAWTTPIASIILHSHGSVPRWMAWGALVPQVGLALLFVLPSLWFARPREGFRSGAPTWKKVKDVGHGRAPGETPLTPLEWRPVIHGNPIAWRDGRAARRGLSARILRICYVLIAGLVTLGAVFAALLDSNDAEEFGIVAMFLLVTGATLVALVVGSGAIAEERERRSMPLLRLSRLTPFDLLLGKLWGLFVYLAPLLLVPLGVSLLFFWRHPWIPPLVFLTSSVFLLAGASWGLAVSSLTRRAATAIGVSVSSALVYLVVPGMIIKYAELHRIADLIWVFNPVMTLAGILSGFEQSHEGRPLREEFFLALGGLVFLVVLALASVWFALAALYGRQEEAA